MSESPQNTLLFKLASGLFLVVLAAVSLGLGEGILRLKNSSMKNYDIEMWRYAKELKTPSDNPILGHEHIPSKSALLQSVEIRTNKWGLRGPEISETVPEGRRRILFLGSSITLGWGVAEEETVSAVLEKKLKAEGNDVEVLNAGIGNYNCKRFVERFTTKLAPIKPTHIVVHFFLRDAEKLETGGGNWLLRHSQLAMTLWNLFQQKFTAHGRISLEDHYKQVYAPDAPGYQDMLAYLEKLANYAKANNIGLMLAMVPDVHDLKNYPFQFIHQLMAENARKFGIEFVDLYPAMSDLTPEQVWSMPGDPHPNALGHARMAEAIYPVLAKGIRIAI